MNRNLQGVGFPIMDASHKVTTRAVTRKHKPNDIGKTFVDNFGRSYTYTKKGLIY